METISVLPFAKDDLHIINTNKYNIIFDRCPVIFGVDLSSILKDEE
jgi:hypothetical protein